MKMAIKELRISLSCLLWILVISFCPSCKDEKIDMNKYGNCTDKLQNQNESGIDCGGVCMPCASCNDGERNEDETGIDCGGPCQSCSPNCTIAASAIVYTINPLQTSNPSNGNDNASGNGFYSNNQSQITFNFFGNVITAVNVKFFDGFNPIKYIPLNQTMIFTTGDPSIDLHDKSHVKITCSYNFNFSGNTSAATMGQLIYINKTDSNKIQVRFCDLKGGNDRFSLNAFSN